MLVYPFQQQFGFHPQTKVPFGSCKIQVREWNSRATNKVGWEDRPAPRYWFTHWVAKNSSGNESITTRTLLEPRLAWILSSALYTKGPGGVPTIAVPGDRHADLCPGSGLWNVHPLWPQTGTLWRRWVRQLPMNESHCGSHHLAPPGLGTPYTPPTRILWLISCVHSRWWQE